jgi:hypothetical protein
MPTIGFLHTSAVHVPTFGALVSEMAPGSTTLSTVDAQLLERARRAGTDDNDLAADVERALVDLVERGADVVVCTCSTIGGVAEEVGARRGLDVIRVDRPMVEVAVATGRRIGVVAAVESTVEPTVALIARVAGRAGRAVDVSVTVVDGAWELFEMGDHDRYIELIVDALPDIASAVDVVVLAQASMAAAAELSEVAVPVLASPRTAVAFVTTRRLE